MLQLLDLMLTTAPGPENGELVGLPFTAALDPILRNPAGRILFANEKINAHFEETFKVWTTFLSSYVLTDSENGWFGPFEEMFVCDANAEYHGYHSWDAFFTRSFRPHVRPILLTSHQDIIPAIRVDHMSYRHKCERNG